MSKLPFPDSRSSGGRASLHISKLECHCEDFGGLECNHGCFNAVNKERRKELDESEMFLPEFDLLNPINLSVKVFRF